jgi:adenine deaminase
MLVPSEFARMAVVHGTVATVSDPHEIANVLGTAGVEYMIDNGLQVPFKFCFGAPSCVPATCFETAGATVSAADIRYLLGSRNLKYLAEMMNWPGVLSRDAEVMEKIAIAHELGKVIDGHAPGLKGEQAAQYASAGISTDHECFTLSEALDKIACGMKIIIREGSAAKNFEALWPLIAQYPDQVMFCSDDKHPDSLLDGHINQLVKRALGKGLNIYDVLQAACINPVQHYGLEVGLLQVGDAADFVLVDNLEELNILATWIDGILVAEKGQTLIDSVDTNTPNFFHCPPTHPEHFSVKAEGSIIRVVEALDGELITNELHLEALTEEGRCLPDPTRDILKLAVLNRYQSEGEQLAPAIAFIRNFGLWQGAIASSVAHDSHNIIAVGTSDALISKAMNLVIGAKGGISACTEAEAMLLPLPVAGLMSNQKGEEIARRYTAIDAFVKTMGTSLQAPFMTLSFMALLVIPSLKLSDKGLFNGRSFKFASLFTSE